MVRIDPHSLYSRQDLVELFKPLGIDADGLIVRIKPIKRFRRAWWGADLIQAIEKAPALNEKADDMRPADLPQTANGRRGRGRQARFKKLDGYVAELGEGEHG